MTCSIEELTNTKCKWPIGDPKDNDFKFCGNASHDSETPYCDFHTKMAYRTDYVPRSQRNKKAA